MDREAIELYCLQIAATVTSKHSLSYTSYYSLTIILKDINDNFPKFLKVNKFFIIIYLKKFQALNNLKIRENQSPKKNLITLKATDKDFGENSEISYSFKENTNFKDLFKIDNKTGRIDSLVSFDREQISKYQLIIEARDFGTPSLSSYSIVEVGNCYNIIIKEKKI